MTPGVVGLRRALIDRFGADRVGIDVPLAPMTTFKVGGPADLFVEPRSSAETVDVLRLASTHGVRVTMLGGGSNVLVADGGIRGIVVQAARRTHREGGRHPRSRRCCRHDQRPRALAGRSRPCRPGSLGGYTEYVGGGIYGNAHWSGHLISEAIENVRLVRPSDGSVVDLPVSEMGFGYDRSRLQASDEVVLSAVFIVDEGTPDALRATARASLAYRKRTQPLASPSAGCIFQNPAPGVLVPEGIPRSAGALVDRAGLKDVRVGGAMVSPTHGNFVVNTGTATATEIRRLIERCRAVVRERFGVTLEDEIVYLGEFESASED